MTAIEAMAETLGCEQKDVQVLSDDGNWARACDHGTGFGGLTPVRVRPKHTVHPYTLAQAAAHIGRAFQTNGGGKVCTVALVGRTRIYTTGDGRWEFDEMAQNCHWTDDGTPCGVVLEDNDNE